MDSSYIEIDYRYLNITLGTGAELLVPVHGV